MENILTLINQENLSISGIKKANVISETSVVLEMENSILQISGNSMEVKKLDVESGKIEISGKIYCIKFSGAKEKLSLFKKIFK